MRKTIMLERIGLKFLQNIDPELAHNIALHYLRFRIFPIKQTNANFPKLRTRLAGIDLPNPLGLAAGFDKNGIAIKSFPHLGFGFTEIGAVTPQPQKGNPKPRAFRIKSKKAIVNHYGFNNDGMIKINARLKKFAKRSVLGLNIGANKTSLSMMNDFTEVLKHCSKNIHFATINVSSPNTKHLRNFQEKEKLRNLLSLLNETNKNLIQPIPLFIKISPDLDQNELEQVVKLAQRYQLAGIIATNTSTDYKLMAETNGFSRGGVSGKPLFAPSTKILAQLSILSEGKIPLIGVGGICSGQDVFEKICAGASAVQLYSALTFYGPKLVNVILKDLNNILEGHGFNDISEIIGIKKYEYV